MSRPWTRSMPSPPEENYGTQTSNNFTQGQSSQQGSEAAFSQVCRLYEKSQHAAASRNDEPCYQYGKSP